MKHAYLSYGSVIVGTVLGGLYIFYSDDGKTLSLNNKITCICLTGVLGFLTVYMTRALLSRKNTKDKN